MEILENIVNTLNDLVWNTPEEMPLIVIFLLGFGIFITLRLGFIQIRKFKHGLKVVTGQFTDPDDTGDVNHFQALSTALAATVGIGNIAGVAIAIHYGGPGALFWMWVTAIFGMAIKYTECTLAVHYRIKNEDGSVSGGPMYYIDKGLGPNWKLLSIVFASSAVICSFFTGNAVQANTVADTMSSAFGIPVLITGLVTASVVAVVILGGIKRIGIVTARLVPVMAAIYILGALIILMINHTQVISTFALIISSAFTPEAGAFGVGSGAFMVTFVWGIKRGLFSNEAGQGSAPIAHAAAKTDEPVREGVVALLEPFIDTLVVCTMTGLVIIITGAWETKHNAALVLNDPDISYVIDGPVDINNETEEVILVQNGIPQNGQVMRYQFPVDTLFIDNQHQGAFNGYIDISNNSGVAAGVIALDEDENTHTTLYGGVIENAAPLTATAFEIGLSPLFPGGQYLVTICVLLFGISTSISWSYYGDRSIQYLYGDKSIFYYRIAYVLMHFAGAMLGLTLIWSIGDIMLGIMTIPNLIALFGLSGVAFQLTRTYFKKMADKESEKLTDKNI
ncbi:MAG: sodium:alanine symporter family protein [Balneolales bacterium]